MNDPIAHLKKHFPSCFDKDGAFIPNKLQAMLQENGASLSKESYGMNWLGKSYARVLANEAPRTWLSEDAAHNTKPANAASQNLLIQGDNLEVLKHLIGAYREQVKMIYIDPPYNTGTDGFVYADDRKFTALQLSNLAGIEEDEAKRILSFTASKSNSHSAWLTFMYPRLYIARELLRDDGVIFISIDDNEQAQLKILCDEVFGAENFVGSIAWESKTKSQNTKTAFNKLQPKVEWLFLYTKRDCRRFNLKVIGEKSYPENDDTGEYRLHRAEHMNAEGIRGRETMVFPVLGISPPAGKQWKIGAAQMAEYENRGDVLLVDGAPTIKMRPDDERNEVTEPFWGFISKEAGTAETAKRELTEIMESSSHGFETVKPLGLLTHLIGLSTRKDSIVLDFFAGSGTTAHAVMQLNAEDGGSRQFICVQIDEDTDPKKEAFKAGYKTIFDITKARIEKAAAKIRTENPSYMGDLGFKVFQTTPIPEKLLEVAEDLTPNLDLFKDEALSDAGRASLLRTWAVQDNIPLSQSLVPLDLNGYIAYQAKHIVYCITPGLTLNAIVKLLEQLDNNPAFKPSRLVVWGYLLDDKTQREITENIKHYSNRKTIAVILDIRFA